MTNFLCDIFLVDIYLTFASTSLHTVNFISLIIQKTIMNCIILKYVIANNYITWISFHSNSYSSQFCYMYGSLFLERTASTNIESKEEIFENIAEENKKNAYIRQSPSRILRNE